MTTNDNTFERYEKKYMLSELQYQMLRRRISGWVRPDQYGESEIHNIYYDTPDYLLIQKSLEKPAYKEKLRLRSYKVPESGDLVFAEIKKKYQDIVYKRRIEMPFSLAVPYLARQCGTDAGLQWEKYFSIGQIRKEIDWMLYYYQNLQPAMYIAYDRTALAGIQDPLLRITFDNNLVWREQQLDLKLGRFGSPLLECGQRLMEVKIHNAMPLWLAQCLDGLAVFPISFSKYGAAYLESRKIEEKRKEIIRYA